MTNIVAFGAEWMGQGPESVFTREFWAARGLTVISIKHNIEVSESMAKDYGSFVVESFVDLAETRGHIVEWNTEKGVVRWLGEPEDDPIAIYKEKVNWLELRALAIESVKGTVEIFSKAF